MRNFLKLSTFFILFSSQVEANSSLSYSGRLVQASGAPVTGPVNLRAELVYTNATSTVQCFQNLTSVALTKGVFHLKLDLNCTPKSMNQVLTETPNGESVAIRIIDQTNSKTYPLQAIHSVPFSKVAEQLPQMGASAGQALAWDGSKWAPTSVGTGNGTVMSVTAGTGLSGGTITTTGTIGIAAGGITSTELANNSVTAAKINAGEITSSHISATANIPYSKLSIGAGEIPQDRINGLAGSMSALIEDVIVDAVTGKAPSQNAVYDALGLKADRSNVAQNITAASVTGLTAPIAGSDAANKAYVDNSATTLDTRITNEVTTLNTALGNKYDKAGGVITGDVTLNTQLLLKGGSNFVTVKANSGTANYVMTLPTSAGINGYVLQTDGAGVLSWVNPSSVVTGSGTVNSASITDGSIVDADINATANIAQSKILNLTTDLANKQPLITAGTTAQYYRGDKTFVDFGTDVRGTALTGFVTGANSSVLNTDTTLGAFQKVQGQINATNTAVAGKEPTITAGTTSQYYRGDKSWQALDGAAVGNTPAGNLASTNVQTALNELDTEKQANITATSAITTGSVTTSLQNGVNINPFNTGAGQTGELRFYELAANGSNYTSFKAPDALAANINYVMPSAAPTAGQVLSSSAAGVLSWISIPSAPVTTVFGRSGVVSATAGDYTATLITNTPAGSIAGTTVQAAINELDSEKQGLITAGTTAQYYRGDKTFVDFATDVLNSVITSFTVAPGSKPTVTNTDTVVSAFGKVQKTLNDINADYVSKSQNQTINGTLAINSLTGFITVPTPLLANDAVNKSYVDGLLSWLKNGNDLYYTAGSVGVGTSTPNSSSILDLTSNSKGFLPPRMTTAQRDAIVSPASGLTIYNTTVSQLQVFDGASWAGASSSSTQEANQAADINLGNGGWVDILSMSVVSGGKYLIMANGNNQTSQPWGYFSVACRLYVGASIVDEKYFYYGGTTGGSGPGVPMIHFAIRNLNTADTVKISCSMTSDATTRTSRNWKISLVSLGVSNASGADNLGNHTASQNFILGSNWLTGDGDPEGIKLDGNGNVGVGVATPLAKLDVAGTIKASGSVGNMVANTSGQQMEPGDATLTTLRFDSAAYRIWNVVYGEVMRVLSSGRVGINTITPQATLDVNGAIRMGTQATCDAATEGTQRYNSTTKQMEFCNGSSWNAMGANAVPSGAVSAYAQATCPAGWIKANGQAVSRTTYANLFSAIGTAHGAGDGSTTFNVPELRGEFIRGWDDGRGVDSGRGLGTAQNATRVLRSYWGDGGWEGAVPDIMGHASADYDANERAYDGSNAQYPSGPSAGPAGAHVDGIRVRPRNKALLFCIKT